MIKKSLSSDFYFPPNGKMQEISRENMLTLLGGQRALLMQIAHPLVGQAVLDHSSVREDPMTRLQRTLQLTQALVFGTKKEADAAAERINYVHKSVKGTLNQSAGVHRTGTAYHAHDPELLMWVWATLVDTGVTVYETFIRPLADAEKEMYYQESKKLLPPLGGSIQNTPKGYKNLKTYMQKMYKSKKVHVSEEMKREITPYLLLKKPHILRIPLLPLSVPMAKITAGLLPEELREQYDIHWSSFDQNVFTTLARASRRVYRSRLTKFIPDRVRFSSHYRKSRRVI